MLIDTNLSSPLFHLSFRDEPRSLAERNLRRGKALNLPSGQALAKAMRVNPLSNDELDMPDDAGWDGQAPLWFYVLKEAEQQHEGRRLGDVGAHIVAEVLIGLLVHNRDSFFHLDPGFRPEPPIAPETGTFRTTDLLTWAGVA